MHFLEADCQTRVGPWILIDEAMAREILSWGSTTQEAIAEFEENMGKYSFSSVWLELSDRQHAALVERGRGWPWNGYQLRKMKERGEYPPKRLPHSV